MSIQVSPEVNAMIFILTGEKLMDADEDLAFESRRPYSGLGRKLDRLSSLIDKSIHDIGESMPDDLASSYAKAMGMLIDDDGKNYLREFSEQLDKIAEGRRKTSMDIMESKWQVIAEVIRLLIEIAIYLAMSFFTGGASASQIMMAKLRSRFFILTTLSHLLQRLHLAPSLTEAFAEAFTTFAVRLAMMNFAPDGRRPDSIDWSDIGKAAAFGAAAGFFTSVFEKFAKDIVRSFDGNFLKGGRDLDFKNPNWRDTPNADIKNNGPTPNPHPPNPPPPQPGPPHRPHPTAPPPPQPARPRPGPPPPYPPQPQAGPRPRRPAEGPPRPEPVRQRRWPHPLARPGPRHLPGRPVLLPQQPRTVAQQPDPAPQPRPSGRAGRALRAQRDGGLHRRRGGRGGRGDPDQGGLRG
ncbi:hypothetical protein ACFC40_11745 [Streptomyces parvus]|uniref:WXG100-like domain-containing protein n=1 Tax=Streptomyces parvus TaxID=66428 RepID=UPI0035D6BF4A